MSDTQKCWQLFTQTGHPAAYLEYQRSKAGSQSEPAKTPAFPYNMVLEL